MIAKWIIIAWVALGAILTVGYIGKPRKPLTPGVAVTTVLFAVAQIVAMVIWWQR